jgi:hypothetical protein
VSEGRARRVVPSLNHIELPSLWVCRATTNDNPTQQTNLYRKCNQSQVRPVFHDDLLLLICERFRGNIFRLIWSFTGVLKSIETNLSYHISHPLHVLHLTNQFHRPKPSQQIRFPISHINLETSPSLKQFEIIQVHLVISQMFLTDPSTKG